MLVGKVEQRLVLQQWRQTFWKCWWVSTKFGSSIVCVQFWIRKCEYYAYWKYSESSWVNCKGFHCTCIYFVCFLTWIFFLFLSNAVHCLYPKDNKNTSNCRPNWCDDRVCQEGLCLLHGTALQVQTNWKSSNHTPGMHVWVNVKCENVLKIVKLI